MVIGAILVSILVVFLSQVAALFPFYMTIVVETFNLSNIAAADNYVKQPFYDASLEGLQERPLFNQNPERVEIEVLNSAGRRAIGSADEFHYESADPMNKPYMQRGEELTVTVTALFPFEFSMWGQPVGVDVPISFSLTVAGLKYYKDLPISGLYSDGDIDDISYFFDDYDYGEDYDHLWYDTSP